MIEYVQSIDSSDDVADQLADWVRKFIETNFGELLVPRFDYVPVNDLKDLDGLTVTCIPMGSAKTTNEDRDDTVEHNVEVGIAFQERNDGRDRLTIQRNRQLIRRIRSALYREKQATLGPLTFIVDEIDDRPFLDWNALLAKEFFAGLGVMFKGWEDLAG